DGGAGSSAVRESTFSRRTALQYPGRECCESGQLRSTAADGYAKRLADEGPAGRRGPQSAAGAKGVYGTLNSVCEPRCVADGEGGSGFARSWAVRLYLLAIA